MFERRSLDAMLSGPSGLGLVNNATCALSLLSGKAEDATLAEDVAAAGVEDRWFNMTTQAGGRGSGGDWATGLLAGWRWGTGPTAHEHPIRSLRHAQGNHADQSAFQACRQAAFPAPTYKQAPSCRRSPWAACTPSMAARPPAATA